MASLTNLIFETDGKRLSPVASDAEYDVYDGENGSLAISVRLLDGWEDLGCVIECQNVNTGKKDMGGTRTGNVLDYTVNALLLTTGKLAFHLRGTDGNTVLKTDDWFVDVYRSFDVNGGLELVTPTQYDLLSGQIGALEGHFGDLLDEIEAGQFDGYSANWSAYSAVIPTDGEGVTQSEFSRVVSLTLKKGEQLVTGVMTGFGTAKHLGYTAPTVTALDAEDTQTAKWEIHFPAGAKIYPQDTVSFTAIVNEDGYKASMNFSLAIARQGSQGEQGAAGAPGEKGEKGDAGYSTDWSSYGEFVLVDGDGLSTDDFSKEISLVLRQGEQIVTEATPGFAVGNISGYVTPTVTALDSTSDTTARWRITIPAGSKISPRGSVKLEAHVTTDGYIAKQIYPILAVPKGEAGGGGGTVYVSEADVNSLFE